MIPHLLFYQLAVLGLLWLFVMLHVAWPSRCATAQGTSATPIIRRRQRSKEPKAFAGLTHKPHCEACAQGVVLRPHAPCPRHPAWSPRRDGRATWTPRGTSARIPPVPIGAGSGWAISVPMGIRAVVPGGSCIAWPARATSSQPMAHRCMASVSRRSVCV